MSHFLLSIVLATAIIATGTEQIAGSENNNCDQLLTLKCTDCHYMTRICEKIHKKRKRAWDRTVKRMIRIGAKITKKGEEANCELPQCSIARNSKKMYRKRQWALASLPMP